MTPDEIEIKRTEHEARLVASDTKFLLMQNMLNTGIHMLVSMEVKLNALVDSQTKLYGTVQELVEAQKELNESQKRTDAALRSLIERNSGPNGHS